MSTHHNEAMKRGNGKARFKVPHVFNDDLFDKFKNFLNPQAAAPGGGSSYKAQTSDVRFSDVAGCEEAKQELQEVVAFLKNPGLYAEFGAKVPSGVLLSGPPGNGKTLLAKAVAGEAGVPFFAVAGSEFVEMYVGVGASRVRSLFAAAARSRGPAIIFIDEIDCVGKKRGSSGYTGNDERDTTLNQLLVEMDGFAARNIVVIGATNRPDMLDPALTRPGRLSRNVVIDAPEVNARTAILQIHVRNKPVSADVDLFEIAKRSSGFSGADLEDVCNEAAIMATRRVAAMGNLAKSGDRRILPDDFFEAVDRVSMGAARNSRARAMSDEEKRLTAYHETGHALLAELCAEGDGCTKLTILPRGNSLGHAMSAPEEDRFTWNEKQLRARIIMAMGGGVASEMFVGSVDTGTGSDYDMARSIARDMVTKYGMSRLGAINVSDESTIGPRMKDKIDREVNRIIEECTSDARNLLYENREAVHVIANAVLVQETLQGDELRALWKVAAAGKAGRKEAKVYKVNSRRSVGEKLRAYFGAPKKQAAA